MSARNSQVINKELSAPKTASPFDGVDSALASYPKSGLGSDLSPTVHCTRFASIHRSAFGSPYNL